MRPCDPVQSRAVPRPCHDGTRRSRIKGCMRGAGVLPCTSKGMSMQMTLRRVLIPLAVVAVVLGGYQAAGVRAAQAPAQEPAHEPLEFNRDVRPVLARACLACHGPSEGTRQADLRLDTDAFIDRVIVPGDAEASPLFQRLTTGDQVAKMPPVSSGRSLTDEQIDLVRRWIDGGAAWWRRARRGRRAGGARAHGRLRPRGPADPVPELLHVPRARRAGAPARPAASTSPRGRSRTAASSGGRSSCPATPTRACSSTG